MSPRLLCSCCRTRSLLHSARSSGSQQEQHSSTASQATTSTDLTSSYVWTLSPESLPKIVITCPSTPSTKSKHVDLPDDTPSHNNRKICPSSIRCPYVWDNLEYGTIETARTDVMDISSPSPIGSLPCTLSPSSSASALGNDDCTSVPGSSVLSSLTGPETVQMDDMWVVEQDQEQLLTLDNNGNDLRSHLSSLSQNVIYAVSIICVWCATALVAFIDKLF